MKAIEVPDENLYAILVNTTAKYGSRTAIIYEDTALNYKDLLNKVDQLANEWSELGIQKGERLGIMLENHPMYIISYYAALKLGLIIVQINPMYTVRELNEIIQDARVGQLVTKLEYKSKIDEVFKSESLPKIFYIDLDHTYENNYSIPNILNSFRERKKPCDISAKQDIAVLQYTGGTTGNKKGAMLTHYNLLANIIQSKVMNGSKIQEGKETFLTAIPLYHVYAMTVGMNLPIYVGATILLVDKFEVKSVLQMIEKYKPTYFPGVPKMYNAFVHYPKIQDFDLTSLKVCTSGSAPLPIEIIKQFEKMTSAEIGEGYGLTEASPSTHRNPPLGTRKVGSIGIPMPDTDCKIVDDNDCELPPYSVGELVIKGPQIMLGYWNNEEETQLALRDGWLYTGDLASMDDEGYFYIVGRKKEMIIVGGFNIYPQEIEEVLYEHPCIQEAAVIGIPNPTGDEIVKAFIVAKDGEEIDVEEIRNYCYSQLTRYKVPKEIEIIEALPRNTVGKILKRLLV